MTQGNRRAATRPMAGHNESLGDERHSQPGGSTVALSTPQWTIRWVPDTPQQPQGLLAQPLHGRILRMAWVAGLLVVTAAVALSVIAISRPVPRHEYGFPPVELVVSDTAGAAKATGIYGLAVALNDEPVWKYAIAQWMPASPWLFSQEAFRSGSGDALQESARLSGWYAASKMTGRPVDVGVLVSQGAPRPLRDGDVILRINNYPVIGTNTARAALADRNCDGEIAEVKLQRGGQRLTLALPCPTDMDETELVTVGAEQPPWKVEALDGIRGPSTGLAMALAYIDAMEPGSLAAGRKVAATGQVLPRGGADAGLVQPIGSIEAKMQAARTGGADVILVPSAQESLAQLHAGTTPVIGVETVREAVEYLCATGATSGVCGKLATK